MDQWTNTWTNARTNEWTNGPKCVQLGIRSYRGAPPPPCPREELEDHHAEAEDVGRVRQLLRVLVLRVQITVGADEPRLGGCVVVLRVAAAHECTGTRALKQTTRNHVSRVRCV